MKLYASNHTIKKQNYIHKNKFKRSIQIICKLSVLNYSCGGAIYIGDGSSSVSANTFSENTANYGGAIYIDSGSSTVSFSVFYLRPERIL